MWIIVLASAVWGALYEVLDFERVTGVITYVLCIAVVKACAVIIGQDPHELTLDEKLQNSRSSDKENEQKPDYFDDDRR